MKIAIVHYHLRRGGVTQVIRRGVGELSRRGHEVVIAAGERAREGFDVGGHAVEAVVEGLGYRAFDARGPAATELADCLERAARKALGSPPDVWCVHNHSLGRNPAYAGLPAELARRGAALVLQLHDFAEDGRPENHAALEPCLGSLYPCGDRVRYALLNRRDRDALVAAGLDPAHALVVPNPVAAPPGAPTSPPSPASDLLLYPARGIRRKNIGEAVLWAVLLAGRMRVALTLPPESPIERRAYDAWVDFVRGRRIGIDLAAGVAHGGGLGALLSESRAAVTTSVQEGFGLAFLEPWLANRPVAGRNIPHVTSDFARAGIRLDATYDRLPVPAAWLGGIDGLRAPVAAALEAVFRAHHRALPRGAAEAALASIVDSEGCADFGRLSSGMQRRVIDAVLGGAETDAMQPAMAVFDHLPGDDVVGGNAKAISAAYSSASHADALLTLCGQAAGGHGGPAALDAGRVLDAFLDPSLVRLE